MGSRTKFDFGIECGCASVEQHTALMLRRSGFAENTPIATGSPMRPIYDHAERTAFTFTYTLRFYRRRLQKYLR